MGYWVWESYGLWVEIPCEPTWWIQGPMGYEGLWVMRAMGYKGVDCIPATTHATPPPEQVSSDGAFLQPATPCTIDQLENDTWPLRSQHGS